MTWCPSQVTGGNQTGGVTHDTSHCLTSISDTDGQRSSINLSSSLSNKILDKNTKRNMLKIKTKIFNILQLHARRKLVSQSLTLSLHCCRQLS